MKYFQTLVACVVAYYTYTTIANPMGHFFIHSVNTVIHEAGHWIFSITPWLLYVAGGSILQIVVPVVFAVYFFLRRQVRAGSYVMFWVANNLADVGVYIGDANKLVLPLLGGGDSTSHDWHNILGYMGWINQAEEIHSVFKFLAIVVTATAFATIVWSIWTNQVEGERLNLKQ
jgi:hypothetical protein